jgi:Bacterial protein of unknown function (DUF885)
VAGTSGNVTRMDLSPRVRAVCDLDVCEVREYAGRHEYDGRPQDLSPAGVRAGLARLAARDGGERLADPHDEAHLAAAEEQKRVVYAKLELHRRNPILHLGELDLACYDRDYAPQEERDAARAEHLAAWPRVADAAIASLDQVSAPVAEALLGGIRGLAAGLAPRPGTSEEALAQARAAHARLVAHVERAAADGDPDPALGGPGLAALMSSAEALAVDLGRLSAQADAERDRLHALLADGCARIDSGRPALDVARDLVRDHPDGAGVIDSARVWTERAMEFTRDRDLVPYHDGVCLVGLAPESRRWAMAMMSWAAPGEAEGPSWYHITPPEDSWPEREQEEWLEVFSHATLPGITVHEVAPGHFSHGRALRHLTSEVRRTLYSSAFAEGWAHYGEELCVEEGFGDGDPRIAVGIWLEALVRVTRLACAIGVHTAGMTIDDAARRFEADTHLSGPAALSEARRASFDPTYGRYTWGKLEILKLREQARKDWGAGFTLQRFHKAMLDLGSPPLGLLGTAVTRGLPPFSPAVACHHAQTQAGPADSGHGLARGARGDRVRIRERRVGDRRGQRVRAAADHSWHHGGVPGHPQQRPGRPTGLGADQRRRHGAVACPGGAACGHPDHAHRGGHPAAGSLDDPAQPGFLPPADHRGRSHARRQGHHAPADLR